jgi:hypothetical protein
LWGIVELLRVSVVEEERFVGARLTAEAAAGERGRARAFLFCFSALEAREKIGTNDASIKSTTCS